EPADTGVIEVAGRPVPTGGRFRSTGHGPRTAQRMGIAMVHQELALAPDLTVAENLFLGREPGRAGIIHRREQDRAAAACWTAWASASRPDGWSASSRWPSSSW